MGAVGHMTGVDSALLFVMASSDDKLLRPKAPQKKQNAFGIAQMLHIYVVHTEPAEEKGNCESPCQRS